MVAAKKTSSEKESLKSSKKSSNSLLNVVQGIAVAGGLLLIGKLIKDKTSSTSPPPPTAPPPSSSTRATETITNTTGAPRQVVKSLVKTQTVEKADALRATKSTPPPPTSNSTSSSPSSNPPPSRLGSLLRRSVFMGSGTGIIPTTTTTSSSTMTASQQEEQAPNATSTDGGVQSGTTFTPSTPPPIHPPRIILAGAPASGKGTQCELLAAEFGVIHISTGDILRDHVTRGTALGKQAQSFMEEGMLVPDDLVIGLVSETIASDDCQQKGFLLDGFPRSGAQARALKNLGIIPDAVIVLEVQADVLIARVAGRRVDKETGRVYHLLFNPPPPSVPASRLEQRADDSEVAAIARLDQYYRYEKSVRNAFADRVQFVDGNRSKEEVYKELRGIIIEAMKK